MAKTTQNVMTERKASEKHFAMPFTTTNFVILGIGVVLIIVGFILMGSVDDPDAFIGKTLSPIILVISYAVIIPLGIIYRKRK